MNKKNVLIVVSCYVMWGLLPLYWSLFSEIDSFFVLANRILWSLVFCLVLLLIKGRLREVHQALKDRQLMKYIFPASILITINWGIYIWAVGAGYVLDAGLGYYLNPLVVLLCSMIFFKERCTRLELIAFGFALAGVIVSTIGYGTVPWIALILAFSFALYGSCKKFAHMDPMVSIAVESLIVAPLALGYVIYTAITGVPIYTQMPGEFPLMVLAGVLTALPLILYAAGVNSVPLVTMGFFQYISPTLTYISGLLFLDQSLDATRLITLILILIGLGINSYGMVKKSRREAGVENSMHNA